MVDATFTAGGSTYAVGRMDPRVQFFLLKRLTRFLPALTGSDKILARIRAGQAVEAEDALGMVAVLAPIVASTPDEDLDFISDACFDVARQRATDGKWYPVRDQTNGLVMNQDNSAVVRRLLIVANVIRVTFAPMLAEIAPTVAGLSGGTVDQPDPAAV